MEGLKVGQAVICNGYPGIIREVHTGSMAGIVTVALPGGLAGAFVSDCYPDTQVERFRAMDTGALKSFIAACRKLHRYDTDHEAAVYEWNARAIAGSLYA